jgi:hypothetical protein
MQITKEKLIELLSGGSKIVTLYTETEPKLKKANPYVGVVKRSKVNGVVGFIYQNSVNNQRGREGKESNFEAEPRKWGVRINGTPIVEHKGKKYLEVKVERYLDSEYYHGKTKLNVDDIKPYMYAKKKPANQGLEKVVQVRDFNIDNIKSVKYAGDLYEVID